MARGKFIILEGGDCSGKTSFMRFLQNEHSEVCFTHEPGGSSYGNSTKFHLYWASKHENYQTIILPRLNSGQHVVSDRFEGSTFAYQVSVDHKLEQLFLDDAQSLFERNRAGVYVF